MRRCEIYIVLIVVSIMAANNYSFALEEKTVNGAIVHDSSNPKLTDNSDLNFNFRKGTAPSFRK